MAYQQSWVNVAMVASRSPASSAARCARTRSSGVAGVAGTGAGWGAAMPGLAAGDGAAPGERELVELQRFAGVVVVGVVPAACDNRRVNGRGRGEQAGEPVERLLVHVLDGVVLVHP